MNFWKKVEKHKTVFIAASNQHVGKTTTTLGLLAALKKKGINVGYSKPMGQQFLEINGERVDKDAVLFANTMKFDLIPEVHSPIILGPGDTSSYLENPLQKIFLKKIQNSLKSLIKEYDVVVFEGTGHPGVGSVVDFSNADVAKLLNTGVIIVLEGGIGNTLDRLTLSISLFREAKVPIYGVIVNKVHPEKMDKVKKYLQLGLKKHNLELLGMIPYAEEMVYPNVRHVFKAVRAKVICGKDQLNNIVYDTIAGLSMEIEAHQEPSKLLLVVSLRRLNEALKNLNAFCKERKITPSLAGIILTGHGELSDRQFKKVEKMNLPVAITHFDTYDSVNKLGHLVAKIDTKTPSKIKKAISLFEEYVNIDRICEILEKNKK